MASRRKLKAIDLFCGAGGSSCGAAMAGIKPVAGIDMWDIATRAFGMNFRGAKTYTAKLQDVSPKQVLAEVGPVDFLLASPECTHHSVAKGAAPRDEASRQLAFQVIRFADEFRPRWIVVENVIQMAAWERFNQWLGELHELGYATGWGKLDAAHFGCPQTRRRLFVVADREGMPHLPNAEWRTPRTAESIIRKRDQRRRPWKFTPLENGRRAAATLARAQRAIQTIGKAKPFLMVYYGSDGAGGWQELDRPLRTVTTLDRFALVQPNCVGHEMRMLQPIELAAAMGFPKTYRWPDCSRRDQIRLLGNAVCPPVMSAIVKSLVKPTQLTLDLG